MPTKRQLRKSIEYLVKAHEHQLEAIQILNRRANAAREDLKVLQQENQALRVRVKRLEGETS